MANISCASLTLGDGRKIPAIGLGTFQGTYDYQTTHDQALNAVKSAIDLGYRHFNTASLYDTEGAIGQAVREKISEGVICREDVYICTKLWSTSHRRELVRPALQRSLDALGVDYVDLYLIHWPMALVPGESTMPRDDQGNIMYEDERTDYLETWKAMEDCRRQGLVRSIGVSNFNKRQVERILKNCEIPPVVNEIENHPHFIQPELVTFCQANSVLPVCFSPLGKPARPWKEDKEPSIFDDSTITAIAKNHNKTNAQVALRFQYQRGLASVPKSASPERQKENLDIFDFELSSKEMTDIVSNCDKNFRKLTLVKVLGESFAKSKEYPFNDE